MRGEPSDHESAAYPAPATVPVLVHLSGPHRGAMQPLRGHELLLGTSPAADIHFPAEAGAAVRPNHGRLQRKNGDYRIVAEEGSEIRVNGDLVTSRSLAPGDLIEVGAGGPVLRYRHARGEEDPRKSLSQALADCLGCARYGSESVLGQTAIFLGSMPRELLTRTGPATRFTFLALLALLVLTTGGLGVRTVMLERRLSAEAERLRAAAVALDQAEQNRLTEEELLRMREELGASLEERVAALEARTRAVPAVISAASRSVLFVQGAYGFRDPASGRTLRIATNTGGRVRIDAEGNPTVTTEGGGPVLEMRFTGTAFLVADSLLLTNRHVARPWEFEEAAAEALARGLTPFVIRLLAYPPGEREPWPVTVDAVSQTADLALLRLQGGVPSARRLELSPDPVRPGDEVVVLGYPTGIRALLARTSPAFVDTVMRETRLDFWAVARRLAEGGHIAPLATRGIVGQVTPSMVAYDAETTRGGSGGPVLSLDGRVVAVTVGILPEFGGSNLGIPAAEVARLLASRLPAGG